LTKIAFCNFLTIFGVAYRVSRIPADLFKSLPSWGERQRANSSCD